MYMYEGEDYSKASDSDKNTFDQLLASEYIYCLSLHTVLTNNFAHPPLDHSEQLRLSEEELGERVLRGERAVHLSLPAGPTRKRKPLTEEQLLERRRKVRFSLNKAPVRQNFSCISSGYILMCNSVAEGGSKGKEDEDAGGTGAETA